MIHKTIKINPDYKKAGLTKHSYQALLYTYFIENTPEIDSNRTRPLILICPGGGYHFTSDREAEPIALQFTAMGYHAAILRYSVAPDIFPAALMELAYSVSYLRFHHRKWHIDPDRIIVCGFSAGGHLCASLGTLWNQSFLSKALETESAQLKPNGLILSYPVITSGAYAHRESFVNLLRENYDKYLDLVSLEKQTGAHVPPVFLWHTFPDATVPLENTLLFANALRKSNVPFELHIYPEGPHGLSLATKETEKANGTFIQPQCQSWITLVKTWLNYTF